MHGISLDFAGKNTTEPLRQNHHVTLPKASFEYLGWGGLHVPVIHSPLVWKGPHTDSERLLIPKH